MATYHLEVKAHSRSQGRNAVALASYRSGESLLCWKDNTVRNIRRHEKSDVLHTQLINSHGMSREELWNKAEEKENRKNSVVAREIEVALPFELNNNERISIAIELSEAI